MADLIEHIFVEFGAIQKLDLILDEERVFAIVDKTVSELYLEKIQKVIPSIEIISLVLPSGENTKSVDSYVKCIEFLASNNATRNDILLCIGGGVIGDLGGFVASTYMRGIDYIQIPTTLLAHDSCVGGKTAINVSRKNIIGTYYSAKAVIFDLDFIMSLPTDDLLSGYGEIIKHSIIEEKMYFNMLTSTFPTYKDLIENKEQLEQLVLLSMNTKLKIVSADPFEKKDQRIKLNFGHTFAHGLESTSSFKIKHGIAVVNGILFELFISGFEFTDVLEYVKDLGYKLYDFDPNVMLEAMLNDKKNLKKDHVTFLKVELNGEVIPYVLDKDSTLNALKTYKEFMANELN